MTETDEAGPSIDIVLIDDHAIVRHGLRSILEREPDFRVVGEASTIESARAVVDQVRPAIVLLDLGFHGNDLPRQRRRGMVHVDMNAKRALAILVEGAHLLDTGPFHQADHIGGGKDHRHFRESVAVGKQRRHGVSRLNRHAEPGAVAGFQPGLHFLASIAFSSPGRTYFAPSHGDRKSNWRYSCTSFTGS